MKVTFARHDFNRMIAVAERELYRRRRVYPAAVEAGRMTQVNADYETEVMGSIVDFLTGVRGALTMETVGDDPN